MSDGVEFAIEVENLVKTYDMGEEKVHALRGVSVGIRKGEFWAIMGSSGSGKSTLLQILGCLDRPTAGTYRLNGHEVSRLGDDDPRGHLTVHAAGAADDNLPRAVRHEDRLLRAREGDLARLE